MYKIYDYFRGTSRLELTGACPEKALNEYAVKGIAFWDCDPGDGYTMHMTVYENDLAEIRRLSCRAGCSVKAQKPWGGKHIRRTVGRRRTLLVSIILLSLALMWSSMYIWDISVTGNDKVSTGKILRALEDNGVKIGSFWPGISSDLVRSGVIPEVPELSWLAVNVKSSKAEIKVRERVKKPDIVPENAPANIVAAKTGIITKMSVLHGAPVAEKGSAVLEGETIVSGAMESISNGTRTVHAMADVTARTRYELTAVYPVSEAQKTYTGRSRSRWALIIGQNRINFYSGSRKDHAGCDKIIKIHRFAVDGVFTLPVALVHETYKNYTTAGGEVYPEQRLKDTLNAELKKQLSKDGQILSQTYTASRDGGLVAVTMRAECMENIAKTTAMSQSEIDQINIKNLAPKEGKTE